MLELGEQVASMFGMQGYGEGWRQRSDWVLVSRIGSAQRRTG